MRCHKCEMGSSSWRRGPISAFRYANGRNARVRNRTRLVPSGTILQVHHLHPGQDWNPCSWTAPLSPPRSGGDDSRRTCASTVEGTFCFHLPGKRADSPVVGDTAESNFASSADPPCFSPCLAPPARGRSRVGLHHQWGGDTTAGAWSRASAISGSCSSSRWSQSGNSNTPDKPHLHTSFQESS